MTDTESKVVSFYANKIHNNPAFYELEKKRVAKYQVERYKNDDEYEQKKKVQSWLLKKLLITHAYIVVNVLKNINYWKEKLKFYAVNGE